MSTQLTRIKWQRSRQSSKTRWPIYYVGRENGFMLSGIPASRRRTLHHHQAQEQLTSVKHCRKDSTPAGGRSDASLPVNILAGFMKTVKSITMTFNNFLPVLSSSTRPGWCQDRIRPRIRGCVGGKSYERRTVRNCWISCRWTSRTRWKTTTSGLTIQFSASLTEYWQKATWRHV